MHNFCAKGIKRQVSGIHFNQFKKAIVIFLISVIISGLLYLNLTYIDNRVVVYGNSLVSSSVIIETITPYISSKPVAFVDSDFLKEEIKKSSEYIKDARVLKNLTSGYVVEIKEYEPEAIINTESGEYYLLTKNSELIKIDEIKKNLIQLNYAGENIDDITLITKAKKALKIFYKISDIASGTYNFDNFGNLSILLPGDKVIRFDLNEKFFSVEEQVRLVRGRLEAKINYNEIDIRFNYLLVK